MLSASAQINPNYNPDYDADGFISVDDFLGFLSTYGDTWDSGNGIMGCTYPEAAEYDPSAYVDDGSCTFLPDCPCCINGISLIDACGVCGGDNSSCSGCTNPAADNYDSSALIDDGSCIISGCMDDYACDYDATVMIQATGADGGGLNFEWISESDYFGEISYSGNGFVFYENESGDVVLDAGTYTVYGYDSYGDGWNGGELQITDLLSGESVVLIVEGLFGSVEIEVTGALVCDYESCADDCGVPNGDNSTCLGCDGIPNSGLVHDECGVCGGDNSTCSDDCGVPNGDNSTCLDCLGNVNGDGLVSHQGYDYSTVQIGEQCWFAENCRYLPEVSPSSEGSDTEPYYYVFDYEGTDVAAAQATSNYLTYGVLYNWPAVMTEDICPSGWHIPSDGEWQTLEISLGMSEAEAASEGWRGSPVGDYLKSTSGWYNDWGTGSNSSGWTGLPGGARYSGGFDSLDQADGSSGYWQSSSEFGSYTWIRILYVTSDKVNRGYSSRNSGFSARCVRD